MNRAQPKKSRRFAQRWPGAPRPASSPGAPARWQPQERPGERATRYSCPPPLEKAVWQFGAAGPPSSCTLSQQEKEMAAVIALARVPKRRARSRGGGAEGAPFSPGRKKPSLSLDGPPPPSPRPAAPAAPQLQLVLEEDEPARGTTNRNWQALKQTVTAGAHVSLLSHPYKKRLDEERMQKKLGSCIGPKSTSSRWDVQTSYRKLFFPPSSVQTEENDPWGGVTEAQGHWSSIVANEHYAGRKARDRMQALSTLKRRFKAASTTLFRGQEGADWHALFDYYDHDRSGSIGMEEFMSCVRHDANIKEEQISDDEVAQLFRHIDTDHSGEMSADEFAAHGQACDEAARSEAD